MTDQVIRLHTLLHAKKTAEEFMAFFGNRLFGEFEKEVIEEEIKDINYKIKEICENNIVL